LKKFIRPKSLIIIVLFLCCLACDEDTNEPILQNESVVIDSNLYKSSVTNNYTITDVKIDANLLTVKISSSGCSGDSWQAVLVDANEVLESYPIQRNIKLVLENKEACLAVFEKEFTFDITSLKENYSEVILNLEGWNSEINYN
jgi:hypothetical protein